MDFAKEMAQYSHPFNQCNPCKAIQQCDLDAILEAESLYISGMGKWAGLYEIAALTNVVHRPVQMVYPEHALLIRRGAFNRTFMPWIVSCHSHIPLHLMWTLTTHLGAANHFVPLLPK